MSTTSLTAGEVMDWVAALMNDAAKSSYTYVAVLPYLNMAIDELLEELERHNVPVTNETASYITVTAGITKITPVESADLPHYPSDLLEVRALSERLAGSSDSFVLMSHLDFLNYRTPMTGLLNYQWTGQEIRFNAANTDRELKLDYVRELISACENESSLIGIIGVKSYLAYKAASFCAKYVAENATRAQMLMQDAEGCMDNILGISSKGRQNIQTRRRPFRAAYKYRGWF